MSKILSLEDCPVPLRNSILRVLRETDEAVLLPQSERSVESSAYKNAVFRLTANTPGLNPDIFSSNWFAGITCVQLDDRDVEPLLADPDRRSTALRKLAEAIPSEVASSDVTVGPHLDADANDRDKCDWTAGFDGPSCCVGLYVSEHSKSPDVGLRGMNRVHRESFLICRSGGGLAASQFHTRLVSSLRRGKTLEQALEAGQEPGPQALRRVAAAGTRNRTQILLKAAQILGLNRVNGISDQASGGKRRGAVPTIDVSINTLRRVDDHPNCYQYSAGCVDCEMSIGVASSSNVADGFLIFMGTAGDAKLSLRNDAFSCIPFCTRRISSSKDAAERILAEWKKYGPKGEPAHIDRDFLEGRFDWVNRDFGPHSSTIEPLCLWGSHETEEFASKFSRELGLAAATTVRLRPELVVLAGVEPGKLRPLVRHIQTQLAPDRTIR
jgi:hypothetical protein